MKVLVLTGMPGSGKSTAVEAAKERGIPVHRMGDQVWAEVRSRKLPIEKDVVGRIATEMRERHGPGIWADRTVKAIRSGPVAKLIIIDGCRSQAELDVFKKEFGDDLVVVAIVADQRTRCKRLRSRARADDIRTLKELKERDGREVRWGLDLVIKTADIKLRNAGTVEELTRAIERLIADLLDEPHKGP